MSVNWEFDYRPTTIDEMGLYPSLRKKLNYYVETGDFHNLIFFGNVGTGKTTTARILSKSNNFSVIEHDCAHNNSVKGMKDIAKKTTSGTFFGGRRLIIMDEFHDVAEGTQKVFNKVMEDRFENNRFVFCVNQISKVAESIQSRCATISFDIGLMHPKTGKLVIHNHADFTKSEWKDELKRVCNIVADKDGRVVPDKIFNDILSNDFYLTDTRTFIRAVELQLKMDEHNNAS